MDIGVPPVTFADEKVRELEKRIERLERDIQSIKAILEASS